MKKTLFITALCSLMAITVAHGQETDLLAFNGGRESKIPTATPTPNLATPNGHYISKVIVGGMENQGKQIQQKVATLQLDSLEEYYENESSRYYVVFENQNSVVHAWYDHTGKVIKTIERYQNFALPSKLRQEIASEYPGWSFGTNLFVVKYIRGKKVQHRVRLELKQGEKRKVAKYEY